MTSSHQDGEQQPWGSVLALPLEPAGKGPHLQGSACLTSGMYPGRISPPLRAEAAEKREKIGRSPEVLWQPRPTWLLGDIC